MDRTLITIATYNEMDNLPRLVDEIFSHASDVHVLVVDDNSPDGTGAWVDERSSTDTRVRAIHRSGKLGLGSATIAGMQYAIEQNYQIVINMDADFSHHPRYLPALIDALQSNQGHTDVAIGSRYIRGGGVEGWPLKRWLMSKAINLYARTLLGLHPRDCSGGYRAYRVSRLRQIDFGLVESQGYSFQEEMLWRLKQAGCRFTEVPIIFADRVVGESKINKGEALNALRIIGKLGWRNLRGKVA